MLRNINHKVTMKYFVSVGKLVWQQLGGVPITGCRVAWVASSLPMPHHGDDDDENVDYIDFGRCDDDAAPLHRGQLRAVVGFPTTWLEIHPFWHQKNIKFALIPNKYKVSILETPSISRHYG